MDWRIYPCIENKQHWIYQPFLRLPHENQQSKTCLLASRLDKERPKMQPLDSLSFACQNAKANRKKKVSTVCLIHPPGHTTSNYNAGRL
jgi:hypothetical protein